MNMRRRAELKAFKVLEDDAMGNNVVHDVGSGSIPRGAKIKIAEPQLGMRGSLNPRRVSDQDFNGEQQRTGNSSSSSSGGGQRTFKQGKTRFDESVASNAKCSAAQPSDLRSVPARR